MLKALARHGRLLLMAGLVAGIALPGLALAMQPLILPLIVLLLFLATLRVDPLAAFPSRAVLPRYLAITVVLQTGLPLVAIGVLAAFGGLGSIVGVGVVLALAAAPITGSPGLAILSGADPAPALRQLVLGTALLPLTVLPVFWLMPVFGAPAVVAVAALRLLAIILLAGGAAVVLRRAVPALRAPAGQDMVDGAITLAMAAVVIGLMSAVGPAVLSGDPALWATFAAVFALNFGSQIAAIVAFRGTGQETIALPMAIIAGNRNLALFLGALPTEIGTNLLLFIGCYQVPMYLTPIVLGPLSRRLAPKSG